MMPDAEAFVKFDDQAIALAAATEAVPVHQMEWIGVVLSLQHQGDVEGSRDAQGR